MTEFEKSVKIKLIEDEKNQEWLRNEVSQMVGKQISKPALSVAISGADNVYPQLKIAIARVLGIQF